MFLIQIVFVLTALTVTALSTAPKQVPIVACLGDSITRGSGASHHHNAYPNLLKKMLGYGAYEVRNFGVSGATVQNFGSIPYTNTSMFLHAKRTRMDIAVLQLGTNDAKEGYWNETRFVQDYISIIFTLRAMQVKPRILISIPPPLYSSPKNYHMNKKIINTVIPGVLGKIASRFKLQVINVFTALGGINLTKPEAFADGCHPNDTGYQIVAATVGCAILNCASGAKLPGNCFLCP